MTTTTATTAPVTAPASTGGATGGAAFAYGDGACAPEDRADLDAPVRSFDDAPRRCIDSDATYTATFETERGRFVVALDTANTPGTVNNFVTLARYGYYDDTPIFRADPWIDMFQAGGQNNTSSPGYVIPDEGAGYTYPTGELAMATPRQPGLGIGAVVRGHRRRRPPTSTATARTWCSAGSPTGSTWPRRSRRSGPPAARRVERSRSTP